MANIIFIIAIAVCIRLLYNKKQELKLNRKVNTNIITRDKIQNIVEIPPQMNKTRYIDQHIQDIRSDFNLYYLAMHGFFIVCLMYIFML